MPRNDDQIGPLDRPFALIEALLLESRKYANNHASPGVIRGIPVDASRMRPYHLWNCRDQTQRADRKWEYST